MPASVADPAEYDTFFIGKVVDAGFERPEGTPGLRMEDTRMIHGG